MTENGHSPAAAPDCASSSSFRRRRVLKCKGELDTSDVLASFENIELRENTPPTHPDHRDVWGFHGYSEERPYGLNCFFSHKNGGMCFYHTEELKKQKNVLGFLLKSMGKNLMSGKSIVNVSLPVKIFEPRSFLHRIADTWSFNTYYFNAAALAATPEDRMKLVVTGVLAGLHMGAKQQKPFNPILGETLQGHFSDGTSVFMEQVSHHPPVSAFELTHPDGDWKFYGRHLYNAEITMNSCIGQQIGNNILEFSDGTLIVWNMPFCIVTGTMMGDRTLVWGGTRDVDIEDHSSGLSCHVVFDRKERSGWSPFKKSVTGKKCSVDGTLIKLDRADPNAAPQHVSTLSGSWLSELKWDDSVFWRMGALNPDFITSVSDEDALPSDVRFREDLVALKLADESDLSKPQEMKQALEERQRRDKKLRKKGSKLQRRDSASRMSSQFIESPRAAHS